METKVEEAVAEEIVAELVELPKEVKLSKSERRAMEASDRIRHVEDSILEKAQGIVEDALDFAEFNPEDDKEGVIALWTNEMGDRRAAERRYRIASAAWNSATHAPVGLKMAQETMTGIIKARSKETSITIGVLNAVVHMPMCDTAKKLLED